MNEPAGRAQAIAYEAYAYAYPHKTAYRTLTPPLSIETLWSQEDRSALFLYLHVPFCSRKCTFCNLFSQPNPTVAVIEAYLDALATQADVLRRALAPCRFARLAVGGGTPTLLGIRQLHRLFDIAAALAGASSAAVPTSVETSPVTATPEKLRLLRALGVQRLSVGLQSFEAAELAALGRGDEVGVGRRALDDARAADFPVLNVDLIYGVPGQTDESWRASLRTALQFAPEELYLYPLYVRPLTAMAQRPPAPEDRRARFYRQGREILLEHGYEQISMRLFRAQGAPRESGPAYCCQDDGMVGLGCGPRSYTRTVHYSTEYAVAPGVVRRLLETYLTRTRADHGLASHGIRLGPEDERRRYVIKSILKRPGLALSDYGLRFASDARVDLPELASLEAEGLIVEEDGWLRPTSEGLAHSDAIAPRLFSERVRGLMRAHIWR